MADNMSGIHPVEYKVLVKPKVVEEKTAGGIYLPETTRDQERYAMTQGEIVAIGGKAFDRQTETPWPEHEAGLFKEGATVLFSKYGGKLLVGVDDEEYRIINDQDIIAIGASK